MTRTYKIQSELVNRNLTQISYFSIIKNKTNLKNQQIKKQTTNQKKTQHFVFHSQKELHVIIPNVIYSDM